MPLADHLASFARSTVAATSRVVVQTVDTVPVPGFVRGAVRGLAHALAGSERHDARADRPEAWSAPVTDPVPPPAPTPLHDAIATEPTAASRREAHGGPAGRYADDWRDEVDGIDTAVDVDATGPDEALDEPLLDPGVARAVRTEADVMRRAARPARDGSGDQ